MRDHAPDLLNLSLWGVGPGLCVLFVLHITSSGYYAWLKFEKLWSGTKKFECRGFTFLAEIIA